MARATLTHSLAPFDSGTPGVAIEPHPLHWVEIPETKQGARYKVYAWRLVCHQCGEVGIGWAEQVSARAQAADHAKACDKGRKVQR